MLPNSANKIALDRKRKFHKGGQKGQISKKRVMFWWDRIALLSTKNTDQITREPLDFLPAL